MFKGLPISLALCGMTLCVVSCAPENGGSEETFEDQQAQVVDVEPTDKATPIDTDDGPLKAFPTAVGYGKNTTGGRGGDIYKVTTLADSGPGSLRAAIEATGPRTVLFEVSGNIILDTPLVIENGDITINGSTAPGDGVTLGVSGLQTFPVLRVYTDNVIIRYLRLRHSETPATSGDGLWIQKGVGVIVDHISSTWASDEAVSITGYSAEITHSITVQNSLIGQGHFPTGTDGANGGMIIVNADRVSIYRNYFVNSLKWSPYISCTVDCLTPTNDTIELINNVNYNYDTAVEMDNRPGSATTLGTNFISNLYAQPSDLVLPDYRAILMETLDLDIYAEGNIGPYRTNDTLDDWDITQGLVADPNTLGDAGFERANPISTRIVSDGEDILPATQIWADLKVDVGASLPARDAEDTQLVADYDNKTGTLNDPARTYPTLASGTVETDTDGDGMPDVWEESFGLDPTVQDHNSDEDGDGYTAIEEYLNGTMPSQPL